MTVTHHNPLRRDLDGHDLILDSLWDEVDPSGFYPDERLEEFSWPHRSLVKGGNPVRARDAARAVPSPSHTADPAMASTGGRGRRSTTSTVRDGVSLAAGSSGSNLAQPRGLHPPPGPRGAENHEDAVSRPGGHPSGS